MADQDTSLPVRSEADGTDERVHIKIVDYAAPDTVDNQMEVSEKLAHVRDHGEDPAGTKVAKVLSEEGFTNSQGDYDVTNNTRPSSSGTIVHDRTATPDETHQNVRATGVTNGTVHAQDVAMHQSDGAAIDLSNPLPVFNTSSSPGDGVTDYDAATAIAKGASSTHTYTVTALKTLSALKIWCSASGKMKVEVKVGPTGSTVTKFVGFNSTANPNISIDIKAELEIAAGDLVEVIKTNRDQQAQDLYSTIQGLEF